MNSITNHQPYTQALSDLIAVEVAASTVAEFTAGSTPTPLSPPRSGP